ncbi:MerR family transcriptional regulator [Streptomyces bluensis]|uniref:MerR family transcriptional regulator n=1 Tax=Streptomyces bluensis TaxID=33897 RepID=UPI00331BFA6B
MNNESVGVAYRIEDLAHHSGATVRTIRAYQDRGLLPRPERRGRANVYSDVHLARLHQIADLLDRGYTLASIKELLEAWDAGRGLGGILGLVAEADGPWTDAEAVRISRTELDERFGGRPDDAAVADAIELGAVEPVPGQDDVFLVPSPQELAVAAALHAAGVPLSALRHHPSTEAETAGETRSVPIPAATMRAVEELVGPERAAEFVAIAAEREVRARALDSLAISHAKGNECGEVA